MKSSKISLLLKKLEASTNNLGKLPLGKAPTQNQNVLTSESDSEFPHSHKARIDSKGYGQTYETMGEGPDHDHIIKEGRVMPAGPDNHTHELELNELS